MKKLFFLLILTPLSFNLWGQTKLIGKVLDEENQPIAGVKIYLNHKPEIPAITKGSQGAFQFELPTLNISSKRTIYLMVEKKGYYLANAFDGNLFEVTPEDRQIGYITIKMRKVPQLTEKPKLALLPFCNFGEPNHNLLERAFVAPIRRGLTEVDTAKIEVLPYSAVKLAMDKYHFTAQDYCNYDKVFAIGNELQANVVIIGGYQYFGDDLQIDCEFTQMYPKRDFKDPIVIFKPKNTLPEIHEELTLEIIKRFGVKTSTAEQENIASWTSESTKNTDAFENFANGLQESDDGNYENAEKQFKKSLEKDNQNARAWQQQGESQLEQGKNDEAEKSFENAEKQAEKMPENVKKNIFKRIKDLFKKKNKESVNDVKLIRFQDEKTGLYGFKNEKEEIIIQAQYDNFRYFSEGLVGVKKNNKWGFIDKTGKTVIPFEYDDVVVFSEGLAQVAKNDKYGYINKQNDIIIPISYEDASSFSGGLAPVMRNHKWGVIDKKGMKIMDFKYDYVGRFIDGNAIIRQNMKNSFINRKGERITPMYDFAFPFSEGLAMVQKNGKRGFIDETGKVVISFKYLGASPFVKGLAEVRDFFGNVFYINKKGECVKDCP